MWRGQCCAVEGHCVYRGQVASLHTAASAEVSCSSEAGTAPGAFSLFLSENKGSLSSPSFEPDCHLLLSLSHLLTFLHVPVLIIYLGIFLCFSFTSQVGWVPVLDTKSIPWYFAANGMQLWCCYITALGMSSGSSAGCWKPEAVLFHGYVKYLDWLWITLKLIFKVKLFESRMDSSKRDNWVSNVTQPCTVATMAHG